MADEFVEVVNTTVTSTELPNETTEYTLKTAGAAESFAIKDIGIQHSSSLAGYKFLLNDFEALSFSAGETGIASGLDLIPQSGTLKIKGTNVPIDSETLVVSRGGGATVSSIRTKSITSESSRTDSSIFNLKSNNYSTLDEFTASSSSADSSNNRAINYWRNGTKLRKIRRNTVSSNDLLRYADTEGATTSTDSNSHSMTYDPENEIIYKLGPTQGQLSSADATANISFSATGATYSGSSFSSYSEIHYLKGIVWAVEEKNSVNSVIYAFIPNNNVVLRFDGSNRNGLGGSNSSTSMGFAFTYDPNTDSFYFYMSTYNTSNPHYISRHKCPKTLTEILAYSSNTNISDAWTRDWNEFTRSSTTTGPFAYNYTHHMRGSTINPNIFYITDGSKCNDQIDLYSYNYSTNSLSLLDTMEIEGSELTQHLIFSRPVNTADETNIGSSLNSAKVRVTGIQTT